MKKVLLLMVISALSGCAYTFTPNLVTYYDEQCKVNARQMTLTVEQRAWFEKGDTCSGEADCAAIVAGKIIGTPLSAIVAGSLVVAGDTVFWLEKQGRCLAK